MQLNRLFVTTFCFLGLTSASAATCTLTVLDVQTREQKVFSIPKEGSFTPSFSPTEYKCSILNDKKKKPEVLTSLKMACSIPNTEIVAAVMVYLIEKGLPYEGSNLFLSDRKGKQANYLLECSR